jgi:phenylalanyl-tRNA synthetase beta chain
MTVSYNWLKEYIRTNIEPAEMAKILTSIGLEVESMEVFQSVKGGLAGFVIGEVKTCEKHPDADKLSITTVDIGMSNLLNVVCGAPNVRAGQKVIVATEGTTIYMGNESFKIKKSKIRGQVSEGMICAEDELGLGPSHEGIMLLDKNARVGMPAKLYFKIEDDVIFEIGLTPNRVDAASHYGIARDLYAFLSQ